MPVAALELLRSGEGERLPVLPAALPRLLAAIGSDIQSVREMAAVIEEFPAIAMRLIGLANSAWSSPVAPVTSVDSACARLGLQVVRSLSIALAVAEPFNPARCANFDVARFWTSSLVRADAASLLARGCAPDLVQTARTAALLSNIGLLWLADYFPEDIGIALGMVLRAETDSVNDATAAVCGVGYDRAGGALAGHWGLPSVLVEAIVEQHRSDGIDGLGDTARLVVGAVALVRVVTDGSDLNVADPALTQIVDDPDHLDLIHRQLRGSLARTRELAAALFVSV